MQIKLQKNSSEKNKLSKTVTDILTLEGVLKDTTSIVDPVILIESNESIVGCNYMTIPIFNRSYFINNIRSVRNGLWEVSAHVDVLSSFKTQILSNRAIIQRQENKWNLYLDDGTFKVYQNPQVLTREFPNGFNTHEFVFAIAGK